MILEEAEPIGGFVGISVSEPLLQGGVLASVIGYMFFLQPHLALLGIAFFIPQMVFVPLLQHAINVRARARILVKREISGAIAENGHADSVAPSQTMAIGRVFALNMGIYWRKYSMNLLMNLMHHMSVAVALCVGGWLALEGRIEVGHGGGDRGRPRQAQRSLGRRRELGARILGGERQVPAVRRGRELGDGHPVAAGRTRSSTGTAGYVEPLR